MYAKNPTHGYLHILFVILHKKSRKPSHDTNDKDHGENRKDLPNAFHVSFCKDNKTNDITYFALINLDLLVTPHQSAQ